MNILDKVAIRRTERMLRPFMASDEHIMNYEIADVSRNDWPRSSRLPVVFTNRAIRFTLPDHTGVRVPYSSVVDLRSTKAGCVLIATAPRPGVTYTYMINPVREPRMEMYEQIGSQMKQLERHSVKVDVTETQWVHAVVRTMGEQSVLCWYFVPFGQDEAPDLREPAVQRCLHSELAATSDEYGITVQDGLNYTIPVLYKN